MYVSLHNHTDLSNAVAGADSIAKHDGYIAKAVEFGQNAIAFTEHGSCFNWADAKAKCEKAGIKWIGGTELYVATHNNESCHIILLAKNEAGWGEILTLDSIAFQRDGIHFYRHPRITFDELKGTSDNVIILTACIAGIMNCDLADEFIEWAVDHKDRVFLEIQPNEAASQVALNRQLAGLSHKTGLRLVATTDAHLSDASQLEARHILQLAQGRVYDETGFDMVFKSEEQMCNAFVNQRAIPMALCQEAIANTQVIADMVETWKLDASPKYPKVFDGDSVALFKQKVNEAYKHHICNTRYPKEVVRKRVQDEYEVCHALGTEDFFLLECKLLEFEREHGIHRGPGRGSVTGSFIAYLLDIHQMDSLKYDLNFFRFLAPGRKSNADIDRDLAEADRDLVKQYVLRDKLGLDTLYATEIITFNCLAVKQSVKEVARAFNYSTADAQALSNRVVDDVIPDDMRAEQPKLCEIVDKLKGVIKSIGSHPSGVTVIDRDPQKMFGTCTIDGSDYPVSQICMHELDGALGVVKLDLLGLDSQQLVTDTCAIAGIDYVTPDTLDFDDEAVWKSIAEDNSLIFQMESDFGASIWQRMTSDATLAKVRGENFSWLNYFALANALIRPGCASFRDAVANGERLVTGFTELDEFLSDTSGHIVFQEQLMRFSTQFCGYSGPESDGLRKMVAKKLGTAGALEELHRRFLEWSTEKYGASIEKLESVWPGIEQGVIDSSRYSFSLNHSIAYSVISYEIAWLRYYYPKEFAAAAYRTYSDKPLKLALVKDWAKKHSISIMPPKFGRCGSEATLTDGVVYMGLSSINGIGKQLGDTLAQLDAPATFLELARVFPGSQGDLVTLVKIGYFSTYGTTGRLLKELNLFQLYGKRKQLTLNDTLPVMLMEKHCIKRTAKQFKYDEASMNAMLTDYCSSIPDPTWTITDQVKAEYDAYGYCIYTNAEARNLYVVIDAINKYTTKRYAMYSVETGRTIQVKSKAFLEKGMCVVGEAVARPGWTQVDGQWVQDPAKIDQWMYDPRII